ncbi:S-layer homology domain-containing protein [Paenibacillus sp. 1_12]|nr:S-layer homology domain-containing protein [Paenibacillus sp. 1_12]
MDAAKLAAIVKNDSSNSKVYTIEVRNSGEVVKVELSPDVLNLLTNNNPSAVLQIKTGAGDYQLPIADVDVNSIAKQLSVDVKELKIIIGIEKVQGNKAAELTAAASQIGAQILANPVEFTVGVVTKDNRAQDVNSYSHYVARTLHLSHEVKSNAAVGVWFNPVSKTYMPVPTLFNGSEATMLRKGNSIYTVLNHQKIFSDVSTHWAKEDVELLASKLIVKGIDDKNFAPDKSITRAEFAALLVRSLALTENVKKGYKDVGLTEWYSGSIGAAQEAELINGDEFGNFKPNDLITREQMVTMIARALSFVGKIENTDTSVLSKFTDHNEISEWSQEAVARLVQTGIVRGVSSHVFAPQDHATRAQSAAMLKRTLQYLQFMN